MVLEEVVILGTASEEEWSGNNGEKAQEWKTTSKVEVIREIIKSGTDLMMDRVWEMCYNAFKGGVASEDLGAAVIIPLYCINVNERGLITRP